MAYRGRRNRPLLPTNLQGGLYYARLKTEIGVVYKLGYTSHESVESRLAYKGTGDERYLDKTLLFLWMDNAFELEQRIHSHFDAQRLFGTRGAWPYMPLCQNGQTELYAEDILRLDDEYTEDQNKAVQDEVLRLHEEHNPRVVKPGFKGWMNDKGIELLAKLLASPFIAIIYVWAKLAHLIWGPPVKAIQAAEEAKARFEIEAENLRALVRRELEKQNMR